MSCPFSESRSRWTFGSRNLRVRRAIFECFRKNVLTPTTGSVTCVNLFWYQTSDRQTGGRQENYRLLVEKFEYRNFQFELINLAANSRFKNHNVRTSYTIRDFSPFCNGWVWIRVTWHEIRSTFGVKQLAPKFTKRVFTGIRIWIEKMINKNW